MKVQSRETLKQSPLYSCPYKVATAVLLFVTLFVVSSTRAQAPLTVEWKEGRLSVTAERVPLVQILQAVARGTGIEIQGLDGLQDPVSVHFANLPLREGLQKLLTPVNYFLLEKTDPRGGTQPTLVLVSGRQATPPSATIVSEEGAKPEGEPVAQEDLEERLATLYGVAEQGNEEALRKSVSDPDQTIRATALELLAEQNPVEATTLAAAASRGPDLEQRFTGLQALGHLDNPLAVQTLGEALASDDVGGREYAIQSLVGQTAPDATLMLSQALKDQDPSIRVLALEALALRGAEGQEALKSVLHTGDSLVRSRAAELLEQIRADEEITTPEGTE